MRRTVGHEMGHGIHLKDRDSPFESCPDVDEAIVGTVDSIMSSDFRGGPLENEPFALYNPDYDVPQIRLHHNQNQP